MTAKKRTMPVKTEKVELDGDFEGWTFTARTNPPLYVLGKLQSGLFDNICEGLGAIMLDWNFVDEYGDPLPSPAKNQQEAKKQYRAEVKEDENRMFDHNLEHQLMIEAGAEAISFLAYDLTELISNRMIDVIVKPEGN